MGIIYCAQNKVNGKRYIGQTIYSLEHRKKGHLIAAFRETPTTDTPSLLTLALRKYGPESFEWTVIFDNVPNADLNQYEIDEIAVYKTLSPNGYNLSAGGSNQFMSEETKKRMSESAKRRGPHSEETIKKMIESRKIISQETRQKLREARRRRPPISEETRAKMSMASKTKPRLPHSEEAKKKIGEASKRNWEKRNARDN